MNRKRKYVVPIIIGILALIQLIAFILVMTFVNLNTWWRVLIVLVFSIDNMIIFYVVRERIKEIRGGEEDDLSKY